MPDTDTGTDTATVGGRKARCARGGGRRDENISPSSAARAKRAPPRSPTVAVPVSVSVSDLSFSRTSRTGSVDREPYRPSGVIRSPRTGDHHPHCSPLFCSFKYARSGAKYSSIAPASAFFSPLSTASASGHGLLWPSANIAWSFLPASLFP